MKRIRLWKVDGAASAIRATAVDEVEDTETERHLEDLLVASPELLLPNLVLVARQLPTAGGPLDLVGIDETGRLVVFELKRGTLTRDAVAQVLDYASDLAAMGSSRLHRLVEQYSGRGGVNRIDNFEDWYSQEYPDSETMLPPRMVLVGLGADERATRIVNFLATSGNDIQVLTFHAFRADGVLFLARHVESVSRAEASGNTTSAGGTKENNLRVLLEGAEQAQSKGLLLEAADFIDANMPCYRWPNRTVFTFALQERTSEGRPSGRAYLTLGFAKSRPGSIVLNLQPRALEAAPDAARDFLEEVPHTRFTDSAWRAAEIWIAPTDWLQIKPKLGNLLVGIVQGWRAKLASDTAVEAEAVANN